MLLTRLDILGGWVNKIHLPLPAPFMFLVLFIVKICISLNPSDRPIHLLDLLYDSVPINACCWMYWKLVFSSRDSIRIFFLFCPQRSTTIIEQQEICARPLEWPSPTLESEGILLIWTMKSYFWQKLKWRLKWFLFLVCVCVCVCVRERERERERESLCVWELTNMNFIHSFTQPFMLMQNPNYADFFLFIIIINPLTARVVGAPQMISQPVFSIFPCSPLPSATCRIPGLSIPWCCLPTSFFVGLVFFPLSLCPARWFWPDLMNGRHDHTSAVCVSLRSSGDLHVVQLPAGSWHGLPRW